MKNSDLFVESNLSILDSLKIMDKISRKLLIVTEFGQYAGLISIGDIQRAIINNVSMSDPVSSIIRHNCIVARVGDSLSSIKKLMISIRAEFMPVLNDQNEVVEVYFWNDLFIEEKICATSEFDVPVVVMAGGLGTRMRPLTHVLPKPLIPVGERSILEEILQRFHLHGCLKFYLSLNYQADFIKYYIESKNLPFEVAFVEESKPLGTAGSLALLKHKLHTTFFVSNCDILIDQDYGEILNYHHKNKNVLTVVAALRHVPIAYGTIESTSDGLLESMKEKPEYLLKINSGMYVLEPDVIDEIPDDSFYHITDLIEKLKGQGKRVGVFPISQGSWKDIGNWGEYLSLLQKNENFLN